MQNHLSAVVIGVGPSQGLGATLARRFAREGLHVFLGGRTAARLEAVAEEIHRAGGAATAVVADATVESQVAALFDAASDTHRLALTACTVDSNVPSPLLETSVEAFSSLWCANALAGFLVGREAAGRMLPYGEGTLIFTGASASLRARPPFTAFASAKFALRALAQGMAREFGPRGIHVAHVVIDGVIEGERARTQFPHFVEQKGAEGLLQPEAIADAYWGLHRQHPSAWTHELDLRPFKEPF